MLNSVYTIKSSTKEPMILSLFNFLRGEVVQAIRVQVLNINLILVQTLPITAKYVTLQEHL